MKKRESLIEQFSTFLSLRNDRKTFNFVWQADVELERHISYLAQSKTDAKEEDWARYFLKNIKDISQEELLRVCSETETKEKLYVSVSSPVKLSKSSLRAERHLCAYLQEACLWAARKSYQRFKFIQHKYPLEEYFQIANSAIYPPAKLLKSFNFDHPQNNIEGYAKTAVVRFISNTIYQKDLEGKREKFSNYGLLKDLTKKEIQEALTSKGINQNRINSYCLVWQCLNQIYQPNQRQGSRSLETPSTECFQDITLLYNERCNQLGFLDTPVSKERIQEILEICIQAARDYRTKNFLPLEDYNNLTDGQHTALENLVQEEEWQQVSSLVSSLFSALPKTGQIMLILWLGLNLTQTEMATVLKNKYPELQKQYQVARQLARYNKILLKEFINESQKIYPEICLKEDKDIEIIKTSLNECLQSHCQKLCASFLKKISQELQFEGRVSNLQRTLKEAFVSRIAIYTGLSTDSLTVVNNKLADFVDEWLTDKFSNINRN
ncbi:MAG: sigma-70 family RNA polymerase sigma factor [Nostoc sp. DedVER02]|uniref:sigma-70 family RNA polymerase sigma factor n=1 Tax=unclassified Nostoc TaxID=2593658 RepID=UPI002AD3CA13|nr:MULTISPECIES: sigma-70 family RNA polymerase sigma factor [unclassified Nostoc]MDZ7988957.1 sigma-70 family RNA polymerase sigma factor [Nostoc sp. DedVER02]MDZ8114751.1 sigma-70 family RNA polymerase sigma factor [Nostoc sp. DedVER01b]